MNKKFIYIKTGAENVFVGGQNRWSANTRAGAKVQVIPRTPQAEREARFYANRGGLVFLPGKPQEVSLKDYDNRKPPRGFRPQKDKALCPGHEADGSPCPFPPEKGRTYCFRHERQFQL